jgi:hypothetical protein
MTWKDTIQKAEKENLEDAIDRGLNRDMPPPEKISTAYNKEPFYKKKTFVNYLRTIADAIDGRFKDELFEHESSREAIEMIYKGFRTLQTRNRLLDARIRREGKENKTGE